VGLFSSYLFIVCGALLMIYMSLFLTRGCLFPDVLVSCKRDVVICRGNVHVIPKNVLMCTKDVLMCTKNVCICAYV